MIVGLPGIEPGLHEPESCVIPLYHNPFFAGGLEGTRTPYLCNANAALYQMSYKPLGFRTVGLPGIEPGLHAPQARVLPLYYSPF